METLHSWDVSAAEAVAIQQHLRACVLHTPLSAPISTIAGCDISFSKYSDIFYAGIIVLRYPGMAEIARATAVMTVTFPYIPGLLSFREIPALIEAWKKLETIPDIVMVDGQGIAHPRRFGIASHLGVLLDIPTIGCAKSLLTGKFTPPAPEKGSSSSLIDKGETVGVALRTKDRVNPVFVSVGHRITLDDAVKITLESSKGYRIPEPTRRAHLLVNEVRRAALE